MTNNNYNYNNYYDHLHFGCDAVQVFFLTLPERIILVELDKRVLCQSNTKCSFWKYLQCMLSVFFYRRARVTFDTSDTRKVFGPIVIDYHQVFLCISQLLLRSNITNIK